MEAVNAEWKELEEMSGPAPTVDVKSAPLEKAALDYLSLVDQQKQLAADIKAYKERFGSLVNEEPGEYKLNAGKFDIHVRRAEKYEWDQEILEDMWAKLATAPNPLIDASFTIDKKRFMKMDATERATYIPALTRKPGAMSIKITLAGEEADDDNTL